MSKYSAILQGIYAVFASQEWEEEDIRTLPPNFQGPIDTLEEYLRINILASRATPSFGRMDWLAGQVMIDIFILQDKGIARTHEIADILDEYLQVSFIADGLQMGASSLQQLGRDTANTGLHRAIYSIPFTYYGE
jgi:hypothetical protein